MDAKLEKIIDDKVAEAVALLGDITPKEKQLLRMGIQIGIKLGLDLIGKEIT